MKGDSTDLTDIGDAVCQNSYSQLSKLVVWLVRADISRDIHFQLLSKRLFLTPTNQKQCQSEKVCKVDSLTRGSKEKQWDFNQHKNSHKRGGGVGGRPPENNSHEILLFSCESLPELSCPNLHSYIA